MKKILLALITFLLFSCSENTNDPSTGLDFEENADAALIIAVETNFELGSYTEFIFDLYKDETLDILSDMFNVPKEDMQDLTMSEIVEIYGEEWQINAMKEAVGNKYKEIRVLTDDSCRGDYLMDAVEEFAGKEYYVDMVFSLHAGSSKVICFSDRNYSIDEFTNFLKSNNYYIRSLYQTCCYGSYFFDDWTNAGMIALNGSVKANGINIFSPIFFLQEWVGNGLDFKSAVKKAFDREIEKLMTYNDILPIEDFFLQPSTLEDSKMLTSGIYDKLLWKDFPVDKSNKPGV